MLSIPFIITLFAASGFCAPLYSAQEASTGALSSIEKRQRSWGASWSGCTDASDLSTCTDTNTWTEEGGRRTHSKGRMPITQTQGETTTGTTGTTETEQETTPNTTPETTPATTTTNSTTTDTTESTGNSGSTSTDDNAILAVANKWRKAYNVGELSWSSTLAAGSAKTGADNAAYFNGAKFVHGKGAAEVMTPGSDTAGNKDLQGYSPFEIAYVNWLCEVNDSTVSSTCSVTNAISPMDYTDENGNVVTGHHDILVDDAYSQIGCAFTKDPSPDANVYWTGLWICRLS